MFAIGGAVGSFLNVVVYRLPAGMSLVKPGSHCTACEKPIRWFDNVPILGWLVLRGRCRDCGARISARYPIVEAITATLFLLLGVRECLSDGENLPTAVLELLPSCGIYVYHLLLLCTLLAAVLIEYDGHRLPVRLFYPALIGGLAAPLLWPYLHPVHACRASGSWLAGATDGLTGLAAGLLLGWLASQLWRPVFRTGITLGPACVGLFLGWKAVVVLAPVAVAIHLPLATLGRPLPGVRRIPPTAGLALATVGWILAWARLVDRWPGLG